MNQQLWRIILCLYSVLNWIIFNRHAHLSILLRVIFGREVSGDRRNFKGGESVCKINSLPSKIILKSENSTNYGTTLSTWLCFTCDSVKVLETYSIGLSVSFGILWKATIPLLYCEASKANIIDNFRLYGTNTLLLFRISFSVLKLSYIIWNVL